MENYVYFNGRKLRYGYTTGSSATAATKAALLLLLGKVEKIEAVEIDVPAGKRIKIGIKSFEKTKDYATATVVKDGGDDPDVTHGLEIVSKVSFRKDDKINIFGGKGVGKVTKVGLPVEVGKSAINPTPMKMLTNIVEEFLPNGKGVDVEISVPLGEEAAKKTMNGKLGIIGGISILGTMGIVRPMSEESWKASLAIELKQNLTYFNTKTAIFLFGNRGKMFLSKEFPKRAKEGVVFCYFV